MSAVAITDLSINTDLDRDALAQLTGRGVSWSFISTTTGYSAWSSQTRVYSVYKGTLIKNGYLHRHYQEGWRRQRIEYQTNHWNKYVKV